MLQKTRQLQGLLNKPVQIASVLPISVENQPSSHNPSAYALHDTLQSGYTFQNLEGSTQPLQRGLHHHASTAPSAVTAPASAVILLDQRRASHHHTSTSSSTHPSPLSYTYRTHNVGLGAVNNRLFGLNLIGSRSGGGSSASFSSSSSASPPPSSSPDQTTPTAPTVSSLQPLATSLKRAAEPQNELHSNTEKQIPPWEDELERGNLPHLLTAYRSEMNHAKQGGGGAGEGSEMLGVGVVGVNGGVSRLPFLEDAVQSVDLKHVPLIQLNQQHYQHTDTHTNGGGGSGGFNGVATGQTFLDQGAEFSSESLPTAAAAAGFPNPLIDINQSSEEENEEGFRLEQGQATSGAAIEEPPRGFWTQFSDMISPRHIPVIPLISTNSTKPPSPAAVQFGVFEQSASTSPGASSVRARVQVGEVCSALAPLLPLHQSQWLAIAEALRVAVPGTQPRFITDPETQPLAPAIVITPASAQSMVTFLLQECELSENDTLKVIATHAWLLGVEPEQWGAPLLEFLKILDMKPKEMASLIARYPRILVSDVHGHLLHLASYLEDLGFQGHQVADFLLHYPRAVETHAMQDLTTCVAFWVGKGLARDQVLKLLTGAPQVAGMSQQLVQLKFDWLTEHVGFTPSDFASLPRALIQPLASVVGPRHAFALYLGCTILAPHQYTRALTHHGLQRNTLPMNTLVSGESRFLKSVQGGKGEFEGFAGDWRGRTFSQWLASRNRATTINQYQTLHWLEEADAMALRKRHAVHVARREEAWVQQKAREKDWKKTWQEWKKTQKSKEKARELIEKAAQRQADKELYAAQLENMVLASLTEIEEELLEPQPCTRTPGCLKTDRHVGRCRLRPLEEEGKKTDATTATAMKTYLGLGISSSDPDSSLESSSHEGLDLALSTGAGGDAENENLFEGCEKHPGCTRPGGHKGVCDIPQGAANTVAPDLNLNPAVIKECASRLEELMREALGEHLRSADIAKWARLQGYPQGCLQLAKGVLTSTGVAELAILETAHHRYMGDKVWRIRDLSIGRTREAEEAEQATIVTSAAAAMLEEVKRAPGGVATARDLEAWAQDQKYAKTVYKRAVMLLYEEGRAVRQRRYTKGKKGAVGEVVFLDAVELLNKINNSDKDM